MQWAEDRVSVRAAVMTSSQAVPGAPLDILSDYDIILAVTDIHPYFESRAWLEDFGSVLVLYRDPISVEDGLESFAYVTQYENGLKIDFTLWPAEMMKRVAASPQLPPEFDAGYQVLLDKDNLTIGLKPPTYKAYIPTPPIEAEYLTRVELLFQNATYVAKYLWRGDLVAARYIMESLRQDDLLPILVWRSEIDHQWSVKPGPYGRRLQSWLRPDLWAELKKTYTGADLEANWQAMFQAIDLFRKVAIEVADLLGFTYPYEMDRRAMAYLQKVKALPPDAQSFS